MQENIGKKSFEQLLIEFEADCRGKSLEDLRDLLAVISMVPSMNGDVEKKVEILERLIQGKQSQS